MKKETNSVKELCEFMWNIENKYKLFELEINHIFIWEYVRVQVYYMLANKLDILSFQSKPTSINDRVKRFVSSFKYLFTHNFWSLKSYDIIFFSHARSVKVDGKFIDIYTKYLIDELKKSSSIIDFEADYQGKHLRDKPGHNVHYIDWIKQVVYVKYFFTRNNKVLNKKHIDLIHTIENEIFNHFNVHFRLVDFIEKKTKLFYLYYNQYRKIFDKVSPSLIYVTTAYYYAPIIKAAKEKNIKVIELQHGIITKYHLGYSFPFLKKPLHYYPDQISVWAESWKEIVKYPINKENVVVDKFRYLDHTKNQFTHLEKKNDYYLIISQTAISEKISKKMLDNIEAFRGKRVYYKLHPAEFNIWKSNKHLQQLNELLDIEIITNEKSLYELMAVCEYQVGVFSTALYEGVVFNCKTILLDIEGIEYMEDFRKVNQTRILY